MNIRKFYAGQVTDEDVKSRGFKPVNWESYSDMGHGSFMLTTFKKGDLFISGGYWTWTITRNKEVVFKGWWNTLSEFDETLEKLK